MAYAATPAATPAADAPAAVEEGKAPPTIDSHGGKLTPITCFCGGPDGVTSLLMMLAILSALSPRGVKLFGRAIDLTALRLAPGLLVTAVLTWNLLPSLEPTRELPARFHLVEPISTALAVALLGVGFLHLLSDALMPLSGKSGARSLAAMAAAGLAVLILPLAAGLNIYGLLDEGKLAFNGSVILGAYLGIPVGFAVLLLWRRFDGRLFDVLLLAGVIGVIFLAGGFLPDAMAGVLACLAIAMTVAAALGAGLRGMGRAGWQGLTGRMAWFLGWALRILSILAIGSWVLF
jgi:hypothetical protein